MNTPGAGGLGNINSNSLEQSNVDLATEFVKMIVAQRGYEANSKVITTTDQMLQSSCRSNSNGLSFIERGDEPPAHFCRTSLGTALNRKTPPAAAIAGTLCPAGDMSIT